MGNNQSEINKKPYRWFEFKPYKIENNSNDPDQSYYNSLIINRGYIIPLAIDQCANLEKQLNLNNEGLSTKYFFKYDYNDKFLTVKKNQYQFKRLKIPIIYDKNIYKIKRLKRFSKNSFHLLNPDNNNYIHNLKTFFYKDIFKEFKIDTNDKFISKFVNHYALMNKDLIENIKKNLPKHLSEFHELNKDVFNFEKIIYILVKDLKILYHHTTMAPMEFYYYMMSLIKILLRI